MTSKTWKQVVAVTLLTAGVVGCSSNGGLFRRLGRGDDCQSCDYGCCDISDGGMYGGNMGGYVDYGNMGGNSGGCTSCGQGPDLMPIGDGTMGPGTYEQLPSQPNIPHGLQPTPAPRSAPGPVRPGPVGVE
ncbi:MAG: hypothetical protein AB7O62_18270 [Pirellulales bacterium]